jgi:biopolymer transport protein TolR
MAFTDPNGRTRSSLAEINITPLVDVVLVLLIIFMITAPVLQSGIDVSVPKTRTVKQITEERTVISIDSKQRLYIGNDPVNIHQLGDKLHQKVRDPENDAIYVRCDKEVPYGLLAAVMDETKAAGFTKVSLITQPLDQNATAR